MERKQKILIVDDEPFNVKLLKALCENLGFETVAAADGREAVAKTIQHLPDLVLMDVMMPGMNGFEATALIKADPLTQGIPVIIVTALGSRGDRITGISKGADDFLTKPIDTEELTLRLKNLLKIKEYGDFLKNHNKKLEDQVAQRTEQLRGAFTDLEETHRSIKLAYIDTIERLARASEFKDEDTGQHLKRVSSFTRKLAEHLGMGEDFCEAIYYASPMHDIGKVGIPDRIILKPGSLDQEEWAIIKTHPGIGAGILQGSQAQYLQMAEEIALNHHERWDGGGYPRGLKGEAIPLSGRLMNLADQYDALRSKRPYKPAFDHAKTFSIISEGDGRTTPEHFDPQVLQAFRDCHEDFAVIYEELKDA
ncbi:MAG: response regulator [Proteobacteria bacterium]|nr:response regulator [Desulfobulbaceae bacterium]MBU4153703.1 response regulator [Pseudomonadota bacterium]MDP2105350.1 response regulator [Desulfobulbaceae bacterium]